MQKDGDQTPVPYLNQHPVAALEIESDVSREIAMDYRIGGAGIHIGINPSPRFVEMQTDRCCGRQSSQHPLVAEDDALVIHAPPLEKTDGNTAWASSAVGTRIVNGSSAIPCARVASN